MRYEPGPGGIATAVAENPDEEEALRYIQSHIPLFAGAAEGIIEAYLAGMKEERARWVARLRDLARRFRSQARHPQRQNRPDEITLLHRCADQALEVISGESTPG